MPSGSWPMGSKVPVEALRRQKMNPVNPWGFTVRPRCGLVQLAVVPFWDYSTSMLEDACIAFNIAGNKYRLVVWINYAYRVVHIRFIGTHKQYNKIDAQISEVPYGNSSDQNRS